MVGSGWWGVGGGCGGEVRLPPVQHVCYLELAAARDVEPVEGATALEHVRREDLLHAHLDRVSG